MKKLSEYAFNVYSQFGEDGIIQKVFDVMGISTKVCVELGAWDGLHFSNSANLWRNGWKGILIEGDKGRFAALVQNVKDYDCRCIDTYVTHSGTDTLERVLLRHGVLDPIDLLSIDVDGDDYYILQSLEEIRPRLIICEYNPTIPAHIDLVPEPGNYFGCSVLSLTGLAEEKGYRLVSLTETNCFFVLGSEFHHFSGFETSLSCLRIDSHLTYLITGYDGQYLASRPPTYGCTVPSRTRFSGSYFQIPTMVKVPKPGGSLLEGADHPPQEGGERLHRQAKGIAPLAVKALKKRLRRL